MFSLYFIIKCTFLIIYLLVKPTFQPYSVYFTFFPFKHQAIKGADFFSKAGFGVGFCYLFYLGSISFGVLVLIKP